MYTGRLRSVSVGRDGCWSRAMTSARRPDSAICTLVLTRSYKDPHDILGVSHDADDKEIKRSYKKLALKLHPDVNQDELAEAKFRTLREAYELLLGKGEPDREKNAPFGGNWEFHDWYWTFSMRQRQRRQASSTRGHSSAAAQQHRPKVNSQLSNLKSRAKRRQAAGGGSANAFARDSRARQPSRDPSPSVEAPTVASHSQAASPPAHSRRTPQNPEPSHASRYTAHGSGQRTDASSVPQPSHHFDPLNLFGSSHPQTYPSFSAHSSFSSTLEEELHHFQHMHTQSHSVSGSHSTSPFDTGPRSQSPLDVGFWGSLAQHFSSPRTGFLEATINRHNDCMQSATQHVVELVAGVGSFRSHMHVGMSRHFTGRSSQHSQGDGDVARNNAVGSRAGRQHAFRAHATAAFRSASAEREPSHSAATAEASQRVADAVAAGQEEVGSTGNEDGGDAEHPMHEHTEASPSHPRFVATEERKAAVRSQLAGLRRKARLHAQ